MTALDRVAVVSDVHGNLTAFEAVLADIDARNIRRVVNLGDVVGKGPRGAACVRLTRERGMATVQGVADSLEPAPFGVQFVRVPFDTEAEIAVAEASGMPEAREYAVELRTGLYRGYQKDQR